MRISVEPESLRALSRQLEHSGEQIRQITSMLNQALGSLMCETSIQQAMMNDWQVANRQSEHITSMLAEMSRNIQHKAEQFHEADMQANSIFKETSMFTSPIAMFRSTDIQSNDPILPGYDSDHVISNPISAVDAVGSGSQQAEDGINVGWGYQGPTAAGWASIGYGTLMLGAMAKSGFNVNMRNSGTVATIKGARSTFALNEGINGTRYTLNHAAKNPQVWKFIDPKIAAKEAFSVKGLGGKLGYTGLILDTGASGYQDYEQGGATRAAASVMVNGGIGLGTLASSAAIGAAVGSAVPIAGTIVGAGVGLVSGVVISAVTDIEINGKSLKTGHRVIETIDTVSDSIKAVSHGASKVATDVQQKMGNLSKLFV